MFRSALGVRCFTANLATPVAILCRRTFTFRMRLHWRFWREDAGAEHHAVCCTFGSVTVKTEATQTIKVSNTGTGELKIFSADIVGTGFSLSGISAPAKLAAGSSATFNVAFKPMAAGAEKGTVSIKTNASETPATVNLIGTGVEESVKLTASESSLSFGNVPVSNSQSKDVTITNSGNANVSIAGVSVSGAGFSVSGGSGMTLAPNQSETLTVNFNPKSKGSLAGTSDYFKQRADGENLAGRHGTAGRKSQRRAHMDCEHVTRDWLFHLSKDWSHRYVLEVGLQRRFFNELHGQQCCRWCDLRLRGYGGSGGGPGECLFR